MGGNQSTPGDALLSLQGSLEITDNTISRSSYESLPWDYINSPDNAFEFKWIGESNEVYYKGPFAEYVQKWLTAGTHPVSGRSAKHKSVHNAVRNRIAGIGINLRDTMVRVQQQGEHTAIIDVWTRFVGFLSGMLQPMPGRNHKEFWMQSHIPALMVSLWRVAPMIFTKTFDLSDAAKIICKTYDKHVIQYLQGATAEDTVVTDNKRLNDFMTWSSKHHFLTPMASDNKYLHRITRNDVVRQMEALKLKVFDDELYQDAF